MTVTNVPALLPDETVASLFHRSASLGDARTLRVACKATFGRPWRQPDDLLPSPLIEFQRRAGRYCGSLRTILLNHTYYCYFLPVLDELSRKSFLKRLLYGATGPVSPRRVPQCLWPMPLVPRCCPQCERFMLERFGVSYTRRAHVGPFVTRCPLHQAFLIHPQNDVHLASNYRWIETESAAAVQNSVRFSEHSLRLLFPPTSQEPSLCQRYRETLAGKGFATKSGRWRIASLSAEIAAHFAAGFEDSVLTEIATNPPTIQKWLPELFRPRLCLHPAHLMLIGDFLSESKKAGPPNAVAGPAKRRRLEEAEVRAALNHTNSATAAARELRTSVTTLMTFSLRRGLVVSSRPRAHTRVKTAGILQALADGQSPAAVALTSGVSTSVVYRLLRSNPDVEGVRIQQLNDKARPPFRRARNDVCKTAGNGAAEGLEALSPTSLDVLSRDVSNGRHTGSPKKTVRVPSNRLTAPIAMVRGSEIFYGTVEAVKGMHGKPRLASRAVVCRLAGISDQLVRRLSKSDRKVLGESKLEFTARRVRWAAKEIGEDFDEGAWRTWKKSGLRVATILRLRRSNSTARQ